MTVNAELFHRPRRRCTPPGLTRRSGARRLAVLALSAGLTACASPPAHYPSQTAQHYVGKRLFDLEMRWSTPSSSHPAAAGRVARWNFDQYNYAGCSVTVHTDAADIIRSVSWTEGCGPKAAKKKKGK